MQTRTTKRGEIIPFKALKRLPKLSDLEHQREYLKLQKDAPIRSREIKGPVFGEDPNEQRAAQGIQGTILERIVYKHLTRLLGPEGVNWQFQYGIRGARVFKGGFVIDFLIFWPRLVAIEPQGAFWHNPAVRFRDVARYLSVVAEGFDYYEIEEWEVWVGDEYLEFRLKQILGL